MELVEMYVNMQKDALKRTFLLEYTFHAILVKLHESSVQDII